MKKGALLLLLCLCPLISIWGQKNEVKSYIQLGDNALHGFYGGFTGLYTRNFTERFDATGGLNLSTKNKMLLSGLSAETRYRFSIQKFNLYVSAKGVYNYHQISQMNELLFRLSATWESRYFHLTLGNSFLGFFSHGSGVFEGITPTAGMGFTIRPKENKWNAGLFVRNYDDFIYENYNIMFGINGRLDVADRWRLFGEITARPAGSLNQLAMKYETFFKLGVTRVW